MPTETKHSFGSVSGTRWDRVYLIGGGPSLKGFDFGRLSGRTVVAVNDAAIHIPSATALFSLDLTWIANRRQLLAEFAGEKYVAVPEDYDFSQAVDGVTYLRRIRIRQGLSYTNHEIAMGGGNSGFGALNLAYLKGAREIFLLGYDLCDSGSHWHLGYAWGSGKHDALYRKWAQQFDMVAWDLAKMGVRVWNASLISAITAFHKVRLEDV